MSIFVLKDSLCGHQLAGHLFVLYVLGRILALAEKFITLAIATANITTALEYIRFHNRYFFIVITLDFREEVFVNRLRLYIVNWRAKTINH